MNYRDKVAPRIALSESRLSILKYLSEKLEEPIFLEEAAADHES